MTRSRMHGSAARLAGIALMLGAAAVAVAAARPGGHANDFIYRARPHDTLIGLGQRLLLEPRRWRGLQRLNAIADPRRIPVGTVIRIPYTWLRMNVETALATDVAGTVLRDNKPLTRGEIVPQGSRIETGVDGSVTLDLADGSSVTLQKSSLLRLDTLQQVSGEKSAHDLQLKLEKGRIQTAVKPHGDVGRFEIETPVAIAAVRGTQFRTAFDPATLMAAEETLHGAVAVAGAGAAESVPAGFGTRVPSDGVPIAPVRLLPAPDLSGISPTNLTSRLHLTWPPVAGAIRYRIQLAPDPDFHTILAGTESTDTRASLPAPPDGAFWLRVRAIDRLGLEGFDAVKAMTEHLMPPPPPPSPPVLQAPEIGRHVVVLRWSGASATRYHVQLARDPDFAHPLVDRDAGAQQLSVPRPRAGTYYARVRRVESDGTRDPYGAPLRFEVPVPTWVRIVLPIAAVVLALTV